MGASIVSGVDAPPVLEACEHVLDTVALTIKRAIVTVLDFAASMRRDAGGYAVFDERLSEPAGIIASIGEHGLGAWQGIDHHSRAFIFAGLPFGQAQQDRTTSTVAHGVKLGGQPTAAAADAAG